MTELNKKTIEKMPFNKLREELLEAQYNNDKVREFMIKNLMKLRYMDHQKKKYTKLPAITTFTSGKQPNKPQVISHTQQKMQIIKPTKPTKPRNLGNPDNPKKSKIRQQTYIKEDNDGDDIRDNKSLGSLDSVNSVVKDAFEGEIERDNMNHDLMERLNSDILIRNGDKSKNKPEILSPYGEDGAGNFAPFQKIIKKSKNDFTRSKPYKS